MNIEKNSESIFIGCENDVIVWFGSFRAAIDHRQVDKGIWGSGTKYKWMSYDKVHLERDWELRKRNWKIVLINFRWF